MTMMASAATPRAPRLCRASFCESVGATGVCQGVRCPGTSGGGDHSSGFSTSWGMEQAQPEVRPDQGVEGR